MKKMKRITALLMCFFMLACPMTSFADTDFGAAAVETDQLEQQEEQPLCELCNASEDEKGNVVHEGNCDSLNSTTATEQTVAEEQQEAVSEESPKVEEVAESEEVEESNFVRPVFFDNAAKHIQTIKEKVASVRKFSLKGRSATNNTTQTQTENGVQLDKWVTDNGDGTYTLTLESYVPGSSETIETIKEVPSDIVLVLDESGSMDNCIICGKEIKDYNADRLAGYEKLYAKNMKPENASNYYYKLEDDDTFYPATYCNKEGCSGYGKWFQRANNHKDGGAHNSGGIRAPKTSASDDEGYQYYEFTHEHTNRYDSLKTAVNTFLASVYEDAKGKDGSYGTNDDITHRVAIVGFGDKGHLRSYVTNANANTGALGDTWKGETTQNTTLTNADNAKDYDGLKGYLHTDDWKNADGTLNEDRARYKRMLRWANSETEQDRLANAVDAATRKLDNGSTFTELGLDAARAIFAFTDQTYEGTNYKDNMGNAYKDENGRNRVVVMFTDGAPTHGSNYFSNANKAIEYAEELKNEYNATVYTVGIFSGADASNPQTLPIYYDYSSGDYYPDSSDANNSTKGIALANRFMHLVSSNYPNATGMENNTVGTLNSNLNGDSYYLSAGNAEELKQVFQKISESITNNSTSSELSSSAVVKDIVTETFEIPEGADKAVAYSVEYKGENGNGEDIWGTEKKATYTPTVDREANTVAVTGFDYKANYVGYDVTQHPDGTTSSVVHGQKLVLEITVKPVDGFLGGDDIDSNTMNSAIYSSSTSTTPVAVFPRPEVDVALKPVQVETQAGNVYVSQAAEIPHIVNIGRYTVDGTSYEVDGIRNKYVDIVYTISDSDGNSMSYTIYAGTDISKVDYDNEELWAKSGDGDISIEKVLTSDTTYTIQCDVISINKRSNTKNDTTTETINVYKPEITFNDTRIDLGTAADYANNGGTVVWKHGNEVANAAAMGAAPALQFSYDVAAGKFGEDTPVKLTQVLSPESSELKHDVPADMDIKEYTTFYRDACTCEAVECDHNAMSQVTGDDPNFTVHVKGYDLVIDKNIVANEGNRYDENQSFVFKVTGPDNYEAEVVVVGDGSATIKYLPVGEYTVTEVTDWSWRYAPEAKAVTVKTADHEDYTMETEFNNTRTIPYWFSGDSYAENWWGGNNGNIVDRANN